MSKAKELVNLDLSKLQEENTQERARIQKLRITHALDPLKNPMEIKEAKKKIARIETILNQRKKQQ